MCMAALSVGRRQDEVRQRDLLFCCVLLAGLLTFKDGVLALDLCPGGGAIGEVPHDLG